MHETPGTDGRRPGDPAELRGRIAATVHELRVRAGHSLAELAANAGIGKSTLHAIESGDANPGIETLWALAQALGVPFGALLESPAPSVRVLRAAEAPRIRSERTDLEARILLTTSRPARVELSMLALEPGATAAAGADAGAADRVEVAQPHTPGTIEHVLVTEGRLLVGPVGRLVELDEGDIASFAGDVAHRYTALRGGTRAVLLIEYT